MSKNYKGLRDRERGRERERERYTKIYTYIYIYIPCQTKRLQTGKNDLRINLLITDTDVRSHGIIFELQIQIVFFSVEVVVRIVIFCRGGSKNLNFSSRWL